MTYFGEKKCNIAIEEIYLEISMEIIENMARYKKTSFYFKIRL